MVLRRRVLSNRRWLIECSHSQLVTASKSLSVVTRALAGVCRMQHLGTHYYDVAISHSSSEVLCPRMLVWANHTIHTDQISNIS